VPDVQELLADLTGPDESRAEAAAAVLAKHGQSIFPQLELLLRSADADQRWWAIRTLAAMPEPHREWLRRGLEDAAPDVRAAAALALAAHPDEAATPALVKTLADKDSVVAALAARALIAIGSAAVPALLEAYDGSTPRARIEIMRTLAEISDPRAIRLMMKAMEEDSAVLGYWAQQGLDTLGLNMVYLKPE
jgi:HEAT repeat protein